MCQNQGGLWFPKCLNEMVLVGVDLGPTVYTRISNLQHFIALWGPKMGVGKNGGLNINL